MCGPGGNQSYAEPPYLALFQQHVDPRCTNSPLSPLCMTFLQYMMPNPLKSRAENNKDSSHTYRISTKSPVLIIFIWIHSLMDLLNLLRSCSLETSPGWHTVSQCWRRFHIRNVYYSSSNAFQFTLKGRNLHLNTTTLASSCWLHPDMEIIPLPLQSEGLSQLQILPLMYSSS